MKKFIINVLLVITFIITYLLHSNFFTWFKIAGVMPNLFVILVLFIGLFSNKIMGPVYGVVFGILLDLFIGKKIGATAIMLGIVGMIGVFFDKNFSKDNRITLIIMVIVTTFIFEIGTYVFSYFIYKTYLQIFIFAQILFVELFYNAILTIILYPLIQIFGNKMEEEYKGNRILTRYF